MTEPIVFNFTEATIPLPDRTLSRKQGGCLVFIAAMQIMHAEQHCQKSPYGFYWFGSRDPHQPDIPMEVQVVDAALLGYKEEGPDGEERPIQPGSYTAVAIGNTVTGECFDIVVGNAMLAYGNTDDREQFDATVAQMPINVFVNQASVNTRFAFLRTCADSQWEHLLADWRSKRRGGQSGFDDLFAAYRDGKIRDGQHRTSGALKTIMKIVYPTTKH